METIELVNDGTGLGFGIVGGKTTGVIVKTILPGGIADQVNTQWKCFVCFCSWVIFQFMLTFFMYYYNLGCFCPNMSLSLTFYPLLNLKLFAFFSSN